MKKQTVEASLVAYVTDKEKDLYRLAYNYVKNQEDAFDVVQESIQKALASVDSLRNPNAMKSWFNKILVRTAIDFLKKERKIKAMDCQTIEFLSKGKKDIYHDIDLHETLEELSYQYKTIIVLRFFEDLKIKEIAEVTGDKVNTFKTRLRRGLMFMRIHLT
ncbi:RNA polymerase sigma factor [Bacillus paralicheniformis]|uniref:RNA polymerase sigma factor n=1 Tax=Bacillus paralicheniformis TaxID=1648923 RepID=UPI00128BEC4F|nr:RNA polymerase sigma factor [Bacillus paralicheniformis]MPQ25479.1 sigma-70 family RNA polymerase sigma factor [Bacillus paralicheniformis]